jgi:hypothetical protein
LLTILLPTKLAIKPRMIHATTDNAPPRSKVAFPRQECGELEVWITESN